MSVRLIIALLLSFSLLMQLREIDTGLQPQSLPEPSSADQQKTGDPKGGAKVNGSRGKLGPSPSPAEIPDLHANYIFNAERSLATSSKESTTVEDNENIDLSEVIYQGSVITDTSTIALLKYQQKSKTTAGRKNRSRNKSKSKNRSRSRTGNKASFLKVSVGDTVASYTVTAITPETIVFSKGKETITKLLRDKEKKREKIESPKKPIKRSQPTPSSKARPPEPPSRSALPPRPPRAKGAAIPKSRARPLLPPAPELEQRPEILDL